MLRLTNLKAMMFGLLALKLFICDMVYSDSANRDNEQVPVDRIRINSNSHQYRNYILLVSKIRTLSQVYLYLDIL